MDLHLSVPTADELDLPVGAITNDISGLISCRVLTFVVGVLDKDLCRLLRPVQISDTYVGACNDQLPQCPRRKQVSEGIRHIAFHIPQRPADGDIVLPPGHLIDRGCDGTFRRTVQIVEIEALGGIHGCQLLASHDQGPKIWIR